MPDNSKTKKSRGFDLIRKLKLSSFFWLGLLFFAFVLYGFQSFMVYQNQVKVAESAELSVNSFASFVADYVEKHRVLVKSIVNHHQERIIELAHGGGYPYDFHEIESEVKSLFPQDTEFAIINNAGEVVIGNHANHVAPKCKLLIKQSMRNSSSLSSSVKSHLSPEGVYHFDILYPVENAGKKAALWMKLSFTPLKNFIKNLNIQDYDLVITELAAPHNLLIGETEKLIPRQSNNLQFDFVTNTQTTKQSELLLDTLALAPIKDVPWQVRAMIKPSFEKAFKQRMIIISIVLFLMGVLIVFAMVTLMRQLQSERERVKQDAEHDQLFNSGPTVLLEKSADRNMIIRYASPNIKSLFNIEVNEISDKPYLKWIYRDDVEVVRTQLLEAFSQKKDKIEMVYRVLSNENGGFKWIYDFTHIKYSRNGQPEILRGYITSVHAQKMAEKNATDLIQSVPESIFVTELNGQIVNMNTAAEQMLGGNKEELLNINFSDWIIDDSLQHYLKLRDDYLNNRSHIEPPTSPPESLRIRNLKGEEFAVEINLKQIELNHVDLLIQVVRDVTLQVKVQKQLSLAKEEAESLAKARSRFVATISHEIRTPMNGVLGMADLLAETDLNSAQHKYLHAIKQSGATLLQIINEVLDFAKLDEGHISLNLQPFNIKTTLNECVHMLSVQAEEKNLSLNILYSPQANEYFIGDEFRIKQLLINLLSNAIKFTPYGRVDLHVEQQNNLNGDYAAILIRVKDTGIGIAKKNLTKLFDSFTQADDSTSRQFGGTGLGLAITKQLVELMGGQIGVTSEKGIGSEFWIRLPLEMSSPPNTVELPLTQNPMVKVVNTARLESRTVLVVEDNIINQNVIEAFLRRMDLQVDIAENGLQGLDYWRMHPTKYDLILMDCQMPVMDGFESTQIIRQEEQQMQNIQTVPIVALTANVIAEGRQLCIEVGMNDFLAKPIERETFEETVQKWLK